MRLRRRPVREDEERAAMMEARMPESECLIRVRHGAEPGSLTVEISGMDIGLHPGLRAIGPRDVLALTLKGGEVRTAGYPGLDIQAVIEQREREQKALIDGMTRELDPLRHARQTTDRREPVMARRLSAFLDFKSEDAALAEQAQADLEAWLAERADVLDGYGTRVSDEVVFPTADTP